MGQSELSFFSSYLANPELHPRWTEAGMHAFDIDQFSYRAMLEVEFTQPRNAIDVGEESIIFFGLLFYARIFIISMLHDYSSCRLFLSAVIDLTLLTPMVWSVVSGPNHGDRRRSLRCDPSVRFFESNPS